MGFGRALQKRTINYGPSMHYIAINPTTGESETFTVYSGVSADWNSDHYSGFMGIPGAWRACQLITDLLARVPWYAYTIEEDGVLRKKETQPQLLTQPDPPWSRIDTFSSLGLDLLWHGNGIALITSRYADGQPRHMTPFGARSCGVQFDLDDGRYKYLLGADPATGQGGQIFDQADIIHIKGMSAPNQMRGMGILEAHLSTLNTSRDQTRATRNFINAGVPTGYLKMLNPDAGEEDAAALKTAWLASQRDRTVAVLNAATEFEPLSWSPNDLQMVEARKMTLHEIALVFGVPLSFLGVETSSRTYRNDESEDNNLIKYSVSGHLNRFEETIGLKFPRGTEIRADLNVVLRANTGQRFGAYKTAIETGFMERSEARAFENLPAIKGLDARPLPGMTQGGPNSNKRDNNVDAHNEGELPDRASREDI